MLSLVQQKSILLLSEAKVGLHLPEDVTCSSFIKEIFQEAGTPPDFSAYPYLSDVQLSDERFVGYPCFLKRKIRIGENRRFTHIGILAGDGKIIHYSRNMSPGRIFTVHKSSLQEILEVYRFV